MEYLHSYWRMEYIEAPENPKERTNPFVTIPQEQDDEKNLVLIRGRYHYIVMNRFPYNAGHLLVVPYREVGDLSDLSEEELSEYMNLIIRGKKVLEQALHPDGFNVGFNLGSAAGAGIPKHLHCHIVPRWSGDTNFMPVISDTRVLPTALNTLWKRLREFV